MLEDFDMEEFIKALNESVKFLGRSDMILSVKKCRDCEPKTVRLERVFKYGKVEFKNVDRSKGMGF